MEVKQPLESYECGLNNFKSTAVSTDHSLVISTESALERWPPHNAQKPDSVVYLNLSLTDGARWMNFYPVESFVYMLLYMYCNIMVAKEFVLSHWLYLE